MLELTRNPNQMSSIDRDELKAKLVRGDQFNLVMTLPAWAYRAKHIPGSVQIDTPKSAIAELSREDEIVVYSSSSVCPASKVAGRWLLEHGFHKVRHYSGGILDWEEASYPLEGEWVVASKADSVVGITGSDAEDPGAVAFKSTEQHRSCRNR